MTHRWRPLLLALGLSLPTLLTAPQPAVAATVPAPTEQGTVSNTPYAYYQPDNWNKKTVVYLHGFHPMGFPYAFPDGYPAGTELKGVETPLLKELLRQGFALLVANTSITAPASVNSVEVKAIQDQVLGKHPAEKVYLVGPDHYISVLVQRMAEQYPESYDGSLIFDMNTPGVKVVDDLINNFRAVYNYYAPGLGPIYDTPENLAGLMVNFNTKVVPHILSNCFPGLGDGTNNPAISDKCQEIANVTRTRPTLRAFLHRLSFSAFYTPVAMAQVGKIHWGNRNTVYSGSKDDAALNAGIERWDAAPEAQARDEFLEPTYKIQDPQVAVLTSQTDSPLRPQSGEVAREWLAMMDKGYADAGTAQLRAVSWVDSPTMTIPQTRYLALLRGFEELDEWVMTGERPSDQPKRVWGDINGDGLLNMKDATAVMQFAVGLKMPTPEEVTSFENLPNGLDEHVITQNDGRGVPDLVIAISIMRAAIGLSSPLYEP